MNTKQRCYGNIVQSPKAFFLAVIVHNIRLRNRATLTRPHRDFLIGTQEKTANSSKNFRSATGKM